MELNWWPDLMKEDGGIIGLAAMVMSFEVDIVEER
jgi:hypothetical protein